MKISYKIKLIKEYVVDALFTIHSIKDLVNNISNSYKHILYSYKHSRCYRKVEYYCLEHHLHNWHDWDKIVMYVLFPWLGVKCINAIHVLIQNHHPIYWTKDKVGNWFKNLKNANEVDWEQACIDWECARFTKSDKPLDAYGTYCKYYKGLNDEFDGEIFNMLRTLDLIHY